MTTTLLHNSNLITVEVSFDPSSYDPGDYDTPGYGEDVSITSVLFEGREIMGELDEEQLEELEGECAVAEVGWQEYLQDV